MGYAKKRKGNNGKYRYTACYVDIKGRLRSAGTYSNKREADKAWQRAEVEVSRGRTGDPGRGKQRFKDYVEQVWLPNHQVEATTRESYTYAIYRNIMPTFGSMRMIDILPEHVRAWI
ncbi:MAG TPA: N-terminal phage integrase SAM-like domain-containing protein, partial [Micromonosporaceae bacterium]